MKILKSLLLTIILILNTCCAVLAEAPVTLMVNGKTVQTDVPPETRQGRTLIPARAVFEDLGAEVSWDADDRCVTVDYNYSVIKLYIDTTTASVNDDVYELDVPATIISDRTMIPVRFVAEKLGMTVEWDEATSTVSIDSSIKKPEVVPEVPTGNKRTLSYVSIIDSPERTSINLTGIGGLTASVMTLDNPKRLVFDFKNCVLRDPASTYNSTHPNINSIRTGQFDENTVRIVLDLTEYVEYTTLNGGSDYIITIAGGSPSSGNINSFPNAEVSQSNSSTQNNEANRIYVSPVKLSEAAKDKLLFIDPGHGGSEVGTIGKYNGKEIYEKDVNIKIARLVNEMLVANGVKTYMLRTGDATISVSRRPEIANEMGAHFYLSIHNNASESKSVHGVQICYADSTTSFSGISNRTISEIFYNNIASLGLRKAGLLNNPKYIVIYKAHMPSIIVENAFMSNADNLALLMDDSFIEKLAQKICDSTIEVLNKSANSSINVVK